MEPAVDAGRLEARTGGVSGNADRRCDRQRRDELRGLCVPHAQRALAAGGDEQRATGQEHRTDSSVIGDIADRKRAGLELLGCERRDEVVAAYRARRPDWVLMDVQMPHTGGLEATRRILAVDPAARVLIVTDYDDVHWRAAAIEAGACGYVLKDNLLDVRRLLASRDSRRRSEHEGDR